MTLAEPTFEFVDPGELIDEELELRLIDRMQADPVREFVPTYRFYMTNTYTGARMGVIDLRIGHTQYIEYYAGHIGYSVDLPYRGARLATRSVTLLKPLAKFHGVDPLWITTNPTNRASRRTCDYAGAVMVEVVDVPRETDLFRRGDKQKCRYRLDL